MAIVVLQHSDTDHLGRLAAVFRDHAHKLDVRRVDLDSTRGGKPVPADFDNVSGVIILGGPMNVSDNPAWMAGEIEFIRQAHARQLPLIGICLGHQLIAHALGGEVGPAEKPEVGFCKVTTNIPGQTDTVLAGVPWTTMQFQSHGQEVKKLPPDAVALMSSPSCKVQAFKVGLRTYGFQFHFEVDRADIEDFARDQFTLGLCAAQGMSAADLKKQADEHFARFDLVGSRLASNLVGTLFPAVRKLKTA